jgi:uncharacterized membrane protein YdjX (TVP38/TMEM64 family)
MQPRSSLQPARTNFLRATNPTHTTTHSVCVFALVGGSGEDFAEKREREREVDGIPLEMPNVASSVLVLARLVPLSAATAMAGRL